MPLGLATCPGCVCVEPDFRIAEHAPTGRQSRIDDDDLALVGNPSIQTKAVTFTATISAWRAPGAPTGSVTFKMAPRGAYPFGVSLIGDDLNNANFTGAALTNANQSLANLTKSIFKSAHSSAATSRAPTSRRPRCSGLQDSRPRRSSVLSGTRRRVLTARRAMKMEGPASGTSEAGQADHGAYPAHALVANVPYCQRVCDQMVGSNRISRTS